MDNKRLAGKVAVVTGASKGIGASIAKQLAAEGADVVVNYASSKEGADQVVNEITARGGKAIAVQGDVAKTGDIEHLFAEANKVFGRLDILINNAGVYRFAPLEEVTEDEFHRQFNTNVLGIILATREALKYFGDDGGSVVNIGSTITSVTPPTSVVYAATKGAVSTITRVLAKELGPKKIRVNSINPGGVETEGFHTLGFAGSDFEKQMVAQTPLGRLGQPQDIAPVAAFLASSDSGWITGEILHVTAWTIGQRVGVGWHGGHCFVCEQCRRGDFAMCVNRKVTGIDFDGGYAEYMIEPALALAAIPDELPAEEAGPFMCAGVTVYNALRNSGARAGDVVAVQGIGGLGHLGIQYAWQMGIQTVALGRGNDKEPLARKLGAHHYIDSVATDPVAKLQKLGGAN